ncbi:MAG: 4-(cytidine 5'-diphospho)-2-C-methyl-D-erythritol kinase [Deltaproteobacteria bacterium]|nr:4-(cytidine 5'-diphospho)-2-C-methyl-D-erythritol kinase [Deltaproteobacteria bacterium]MBN2688506.1 4-(cytidine 5'-diphospho)-2-C-methyl-D-erythritol kinase [Deltaproteobacteria bacterium]
MTRRLSPAKVNLILHVLRKREDGYHDIASLMQKISLCDEMTFSLGGDRIVVKCPGSGLPENEDNIVYKAVQSLFSHIEYRSGVEITITKRIPIAAGLGGGSSNAATSLVALNEMIGCGLTRDELTAIGSKIGADVPFFINSGGACWAFGIGDRLQAVEGMPSMWFVLVNPRFEVSTKKVYESLKMGLTKEVIKYNIPRLRKVPQIVRALSNDLENVTLKLHPVIGEIKDILVTYGALRSLMSGSGPTVFGIFHDEETARKAEEKLSTENVGAVFIASSL